MKEKMLDCLLAIPLAALACVALYRVLYIGLPSGVAYGGRSLMTIHRSEDPIAFWFNIGLDLTIVVVCLVTALCLLLRKHTNIK